MFNYYDNRLKLRLNILKRKAIKNIDLGTQLLLTSHQIMNYIKWDEMDRKEKDHGPQVSKSYEHHRSCTDYKNP